MIFGLMNAPCTFQRMMDQILAGLRIVRVYLDDVVIFSKTVEEHMKHLAVVLDSVVSDGLKVQISKCDLVQNQVALLHHIVDSCRIAPDPEKIVSSQNVATPHGATSVRSFLGFPGITGAIARTSQISPRPCIN